MVKFLGMIFGLTALVLSIFGFITNKTILMPYMIFFLGAMLLVLGISEFQLKRK
ncbi:DUF3953 domain-containing protein [Bacillus sp. EAC]|uniref:DUF3953 domain-containing protein n=1 Tax=Bacillus sp. EAC TaxID=1978338 RepID=UPI000B4485F5|nr:DUF3953 domain-containing protein [Bacillus sp. EAC]